jgi:hypothetical protein
MHTVTSYLSAVLHGCGFVAGFLIVADVGTTYAQRGREVQIRSCACIQSTIWYVKSLSHRCSVFQHNRMFLNYAVPSYASIFHDLVAMYNPCYNRR